LKKHKIILVVTILIILLAGFGVQTYITGIWSSWVDYRSPLSGFVVAGDDWSSSAIGNRVIIILIDGARPDVVDEYSSKGVYQFIRQNGVLFSNAYAVTPTYSVPARAAISTGLPHELSGVSSNWYDAGTLEIPSIFSLAHNRGLYVAAIGDGSIETLFGDYLDVYIEIEEKEGHMYDSINAAIELLDSNNPPNLLWIGLADVDHYGHLYGAKSSEYKSAVEEAGTLIEDFIQFLMDKNIFDDTLLVVVSDHGHLDRGGHGGEEEVVKRIYLGLVGGGVKQNLEIVESVYQMSIAPTILAYLGLSPNLIAYSPPLHKAFMDEYQEIFSRYSSRLIEIYLDALYYLMQEYDIDPILYQDKLDQVLEYKNLISNSILNKDFVQALNYSSHAYSNLEDIYGEIRNSIITRTSAIRYSLISVIGVISVLLLYISYKLLLGRQLIIPFTSAVIISAVFWTMFIGLFGYSTSMSAINVLEDYITAVMFSTLLAVIIGAVVASIWLRKILMYVDKWFIIVSVYLITILIAMIILSIPTMIMIFQYGYKVIFPFPNWTIGYLYYTSVLSIMFMMLFNWIIAVILVVFLYKK
jgi:hypothetical protein